MNKRVDAECAVGSDEAAVAPLEKIEAGPPHQRSVGEDPEVLVALTRTSIHRGGRRRATALGVGNLCRPNRGGGPLESDYRCGGRNPAFRRFGIQMMRDPTSIQSRRRTGLRYTILLFIVFALIAGWTAFWKFAAGRTETAIDGWRAREAKSGRIYTCGSQNVGGFPF